MPCAPGYHGEDQSAARFAEEARRIGYPLMVKASAGGGGRGMRVVRAPEALEAALRSARAEAESAFGDGRLLLERALLGARHVEIQVFGDEHGAIVHLGERDCSIQRRHQKLIEESPSPAVSPELRASMGGAAVQAARAVGYVGAGTVEFLLADDGSFYFLEMNTRIQVEHPVTECVTGIDLVRLQFQVAQGRALPFGQSDVALARPCDRGAALCGRPSADFLPSTGRIVAWRPGEGEGVRVDCGVESGATVGPHYDSLLAKVIAFGSDREEARRRLVRALGGTFVAGVATNRDFLVDALSRREFVDGEATTAFLAGAPPHAAPPSREAIALAALLFVDRGAPAPTATPTATWRASPLRLAVDGVEARASVRRQGGERIVTIDGETMPMRLLSRAGDDIRFSCGGVDRRAALRPRRRRRSGSTSTAPAGAFVDRTYAPPRLKDEDSDGAVRSPVSGVIVGVEARAGDRVRRGQALATVEAMKMQYSILAPIDGVVQTANAVAGAQAQARAILFAIEPHGDH